MVRATVCGRGRRGDGFTSDWNVARCEDCALRRPIDRSHCLHCHRPIGGNCIHLQRFGAWLHAECESDFKRSPLGRHLHATFPDLYHPQKCSRCGRPGKDHGSGCKAAR
ncbi:MAG TPA: hypothetical protein VFG23_18300 [Polyangia bacterium]|nr:hypothetical protein [Polyangia bacterium]